MKPHLTLCAALALAACNGDGKKETGGKAGGEILPASVSDAMLPYDTVRSQAPLAQKAGGGEDGEAKAKPAAKPDAAPAPKAEAPAAPEPED